MNNNIIDLTPLYEKQAALDETIAINHHINYEVTRSRRTLALYVEIGEFANATRCFKYWSNKPSESRAVVLDEFADGMHFFLSLGIDIKTTVKEFNLTKKEIPLSDQIVVLYQLIGDFSKSYSEQDYVKAFSYFLSLSLTLGYSKEDIIEAYYLKLGENYHRQDTNY